MTAVPRISDFATRLAAVEKAIGILQRTSRLSNASIGSGGLSIYDGGGINVNDGGRINVDGGQVVVLEGGKIIVDQGGQFALTNGGTFNLNYPIRPDGTQPSFYSAAAVGPNQASLQVSKPTGHALFFASVHPEATEGLIGFGESSDPNPPGILFNGQNIALTAKENVILTLANLRVNSLPSRTGAANLHITPAGDIGVISSLREMKENIKPLEVDPLDVLAIEPVTYTSKADPEEGVMAGVIAEDVEAIGGLGPFLMRDLKGNLRGFDYGTFPIALLALARAQAEQITEQAEAIKEQAAQIKALTARLDALDTGVL